MRLCECLLSACSCGEAPDSTSASEIGAFDTGVHMSTKHLKLGLPMLCAVALGAAALYLFGAGAGQSKSTTVRGLIVPVDCSHARGIRGRDFAPDPSSGVCLMPQASFRRLYPEIAQHTDESTWQ